VAGVGHPHVGPLTCWSATNHGTDAPTVAQVAPSCDVFVSALTVVSSTGGSERTVLRSALLLPF